MNDWEKIHMNGTEVEQLEAKFVPSSETIYTLGLGPCIGCGLRTKDWSFLLHLSDPRHEEPVFDEWLAQVSRHLDVGQIQEISPIVAGGALVTREDEEMGMSNEDILDSREFTVDKLKEFGFREPRVNWGSPGDVHSIYLYADNSDIEVEVDNFDGADATATRTVVFGQPI